MTDAIHEQLSAFLDGELSAAESELLLKRVERDPVLAGRLKRYMLAGEALRAPAAQGPSRGFAARVAAAVDNESIPARARLFAGQWLKPVAGGAIAAGAAALVLVSLRPAPGESQQGAPMAAVQPPAAAVQAVPLNSSPIATVAQTNDAQTNDGQTNNGQANDGQAINSQAIDGSDRFVVPLSSARNAQMRVVNQGRLANYVVAHSEYSSPLGRRNVLTGLLAEEGGMEEFAVELNPDGTVTVTPRPPANQPQTQTQNQGAPGR